MLDWITGLTSRDLSTMLPSLQDSWIAIGLFATLLVVLMRSFTFSRETAGKLAHKDKELRLFLDAMNEHSMVNISGADRRMTFVNETFAEATGYSVDELIGQRVADFLVDPASGNIPEMLAILGAGRIWTGETRIRRKDGTFMWTQTTIVPEMDETGKLQRTIALRTDITATKARLAAEEQGQVLDLIRDRVYVFSAETLELTYVNRFAQELLGWNDDEIAGRHVGDAIQGFDEAAFLRRAEPLFAGTEEFVAYESSHNGAASEVVLQLTALSGTEPCFIAVVRDASRRKQAENARAEFVATVSHELRSPLTSVLGALKLVGTGALGEIPQKPAAMLNLALRNVDRMLLLIKDILDVEKLEAGKLEFDMHPTDLVKVVKDTVATTVGYGAEYGVSVRASGLRMPILVEADGHRINQVLTNLISNAIKFSHRGGTVDLELLDRGESAVICVRDSGIGIPIDAQPALFERFVQAEGAETQARGGSGLGLNISRSIIERHGGKISFESTEGVGTTFFVDLPKTAQATVAA